MNHELNSLVERNRERVARGEWEAALPELLQARAQAPDQFDVLYLCGSCYYHLGQMREAFTVFGQCYSLKPKDTNSLYYGGIAMRRLGMLEESVTALTMAMELDLSDYLAAGHRGIALAALGRHQQAVPDLRRFLTRISESVRGLRGNEEATVEEARRALLSLGEDFPVPGPEELIVLQTLEANAPQDVVAHLTRPASAWEFYYLGDALNCVGRPQEAVQALDQAQRLNPLLLDAYRLRAEAYSRFEPEPAVENYRLYLQHVDPWNGSVWGSLGGTLRNLRRYSEAEQALRKALAILGPASPSVIWENLGICQLNTGDHLQAVASLTVALATWARGCSPELKYYRACAYDELGEVDAAITDFKAYLEEGGQVPYAARRLAELLPQATPPEEMRRKEASPSIGPLKEWEDPALAPLRALVEQGRWRELQEAFESLRGDARTYCLYEVQRKVVGWQEWLDVWARECPTSSVCRSFRGNRLLMWAWEARGTCWAKDVSEEDWKLFNERIARAAAEFQEAMRLDPDDPTPYAGFITYNKGVSGPLEDAFYCFEEAVKRCPGHRAAHESMVTRLTKKWGGSHELHVQFRYKVIDNLPEGSSLYTVHAQSMVEDLIGDETKVYAKDQAVERLVKSYRRSLGSPLYKEDLYTVSDSNYFACVLWWTKQYDLAAREFQRLGNRMTLYPWGFLGKPPVVFLHARAECRAYGKSWTRESLTD